MKIFSGKRMLMILAAVLIAAGLFYLLRGGLEKNIVYFVTPSELLAKGKEAVDVPIRLGGVVVQGSIQNDGPLTSFDLTDDKTTLKIISRKTPPQMFQDGIGAVVEGALRNDGAFEAERLMVKHGNEYRPPKEGEMPREVYRSLQRGS